MVAGRCVDEVRMLFSGARIGDKSGCNCNIVTSDFRARFPS